MKTHNREILLYYHPDSSVGKKTLAYAKSQSKHIKAFAFSKNPSSHMSWEMILKSLGAHPKEILNKAHPLYQEKFRGKDFDTRDWLNVLQNFPELIKAPIAIKGEKAVLCNSPTDIFKLN